MKYHTLHINDSGSIEQCDEKIINGQKTLVCRLYNDKEFNSINDILFSYDYVMNKKAFDLFEKSNIIPYDLTPVIVKKVNVDMGLFRFYKSLNYRQVKLKTSENMLCYNWINFDESEILILRDEKIEGKLESHENLLKLIQENRNISSKITDIYSLDIKEREKKERTKDLKNIHFKSNRIVFNKRFDSSIDLFQIPLYSWGTYISDRFKQLLLKNNISDLNFASSNVELNELWKPHYPNIEFE
ncbi:hypothetical protein VBZ51_05635 [Maribacter sp. HS]|uniref:hypothetical protein n=1 Tax=Maribacter sp. HS TaxID=3110480 RepID=UPI003A84371A